MRDRSNCRGAASGGAILVIPLLVLIGFIIFFSGGPGSFLATVDHTIRQWAVSIYQWVARLL